MERLLVALIVLVAAAYAAWALTPAMTRNRLALRAAGALGGSQQAGLRGRLAALLQRLGQAPAGGCGSCPANKLTPAERADREPR
ncbi:MAG TPA: DUF6587 family protein [Steroidobacteraceae bacterium]